ncbi:DUF5988 family protein [Streptomyces sp. NPDC006733]|uniref:DUF5988 family protein n=1 Tax=Streptomyces sp. NPDC006733 TaxID=3155460 RepID=UPI0034048893
MSLEGGPAWMVTGNLLVRTDESVVAVKILNGSRYEHFADSGRRVSVRGENERVFSWSHCSYLAE